MSAWVIADLSKQKEPWTWWGEGKSPHLSLKREIFCLSSPPNTLTSLEEMTWTKLKLNAAPSFFSQRLLYKGTWEEALVCTVLAWACCSLGPVLCLAFNLPILPCSFWIKPGLVGARGCFNHQCEQSQEFTSIFKPVSWSHWKSVLELEYETLFFETF